MIEYMVAPLAAASSYRTLADSYIPASRPVVLGAAHHHNNKREDLAFGRWWSFF
jgi:hypothetical protein